MNAIDVTLLHDTLLAALREDIGAGDITSRATISANTRATARYTAKQAFVVAGVPVVQELVRLVDAEIAFETLTQEGASISSGTALAEIRGSARSILTVERTSLNVLQRMCGIA